MLWLCAKPNKSNLAFLKAFDGLENCDLALWHFLAFLDKFGLQDLTLA